MKALIACEFSGTVREAFRCRGYDAVSCDMLPSELPGPHYQGDVWDIVDGGWDMMIAHPPCQYLSLAGNKYLKDNPERIAKREKALQFFIRLYNSKIKYVALENPCGYANRKFRKPDQTVQPFQFGDNARKLTCLWLKNLPAIHIGGLPLFGISDTSLPKPKPQYTREDGKNVYFTEGMKTSGKQRQLLRSKTFPGIANAMAEQWGGYVLEQLQRRAG